MGRRRLLVPEARKALQSMKLDIMADAAKSAAEKRGDPPAGRPSADRSWTVQQSGVREPDGGSMTTKEAGAKGGAVGGNMVKRLVELAQKELAAPKNDGG
ncbi:MAG: small, acid-soluble spore protein, alpha/beta type [Bacilli bacterium]